MSEIIEVKVGSKHAKRQLFHFVQGKQLGLYNIDRDELWNWVENDEIKFKEDSKRTSDSEADKQ